MSNHISNTFYMRKSILSIFILIDHRIIMATMVFYCNGLILLAAVPISIGIDAEPNSPKQRNVQSDATTETQIKLIRDSDSSKSVHSEATNKMFETGDVNSAISNGEEAVER
jgi:hypothetical protein